MRELFAHYENELVTLRRLCREFAERFPKVAGNLHIVGEACDDPHVERLIQGVALLSARIAKRLDDDYPQFTEALFNVLFPHYLRPFPSCAVARIGSHSADSTAAMPVKIVPRGTIMDSVPVDAIPCAFTSAFDVVIAPVCISAARFDPLIGAPAGVVLPLRATSCLSIELEVSGPAVFSELGMDTLRLYIDGEASFCAALRDTLFMRAARAYAEFDDGRWLPLTDIPLAPVGFADDEALIPFDARSHPAYRVLSEYFAFPDKFNFIDLDLAAIMRHAARPCRRFTLHVAVAGLRADSTVARMLASLTPHNLLLSCTPVVNLFAQPAVPISFTQLSADYAIKAHATHAHLFEIYSINSVQMLRQHGSESALTEFRPFYSLRHGESPSKKGRYWLLRHHERLTHASPGHEKTITLVDTTGEPLAIGKAGLSVDISCTNRHYPTLLKHGQRGGDLEIRGARGGHLIRFLRRPSTPLRFENGHGAHWRLISHLTLNHHALSTEGLEGLREMLTLYDLPQSPISQRQISGIVGLESAETVTWIRRKQGASLAHGMEIRITLDEEAYVGGGIHVFAQVVEEYLRLYIQTNSFMELVVLSHSTGEELMRCKPRSGTMQMG